MNDKAVICPECGAPMVLRATQKYKHKNGSPRKFYGCSTWPKCNATHGAHPDGRPLGVPGDLATKKARMEAHAHFDGLAQARKWSRNEAYRWLREQLGLTRDECHIAMFSIEMCRRVVEVCESQREPLSV